MNIPYQSGAGSEAFVVGTAFAMEQGVTSELIAGGRAGVYGNCNQKRRTPKTGITKYLPR